jgi:hypothetical protein
MKLTLPPWSAFHHDIGLLVFRPRGVIDDAMLEKSIAIVETMEVEAEKPFNRYLDLSGIDAIDLRFEVVFRTALQRRLTRAKMPPVKVAALVTSPPTKRLGQMFVLLTENSPLKVKLFDQAKDAAAWLGVKMEDLELAP